MIETEQTVLIKAPIERVWAYARDIEGWASLMPGLQSCQILSEDDSAWTLKVGAGGLVRVVKVKVHVDEWDGPARAAFTYDLERDPVMGGGTYRAVARGAGETEVTLAVRVEGSGRMAPMWEAMGRPLLPQFAKAFANQLKDAIERQEAEGPAEASARARLLGWLKAIWHVLSGRSVHRQSI